MSDEIITRPDGRIYRPRKVVAHAISDRYDDDLIGVVVLGTHDILRARALADEYVAWQIGSEFTAVTHHTGWWRDGFEYGHRVWVSDPVKGRAGVMFQEIVEVSR